MARMTPRKSACWREVLQVLDVTEQRCRGALEVLAAAREGEWVQSDPPDDADSAEVLEDCLAQIPFLIARIRELEQQLDGYLQVQRGPLHETRRHVAPEPAEELSQVPEDWEKPSS